MTQASLADTDGLTRMMDTADKTGSKDLARVAFAVATRRDDAAAGQLVQRYLAMFPEHKTVYEEYRQIPTEEQLARQRENLDRLVTVPDRARLVPRPRVG